jgi:hypothetical protein
MYYTFRQNNSGGSFIGFEYICIEADSADDANEAVKEYGVYFNGVGMGVDCQCCGDRWGRVDEYDAHDVPSHYGEPLSPNDPSVLIVKW